MPTDTFPIRWLHLSDFHVSKDTYAHRQLFQYIIHHVEKKKEEGFVPDFLFITGDLANAGLEEEYRVFWNDFVRPLQQAIGGDIAQRTFVVPGNHDVNRKKNPAFDRSEIAQDPSYFHADANGQDLRSILLPRFEAFRAADQTPDQGAIFSEAGAFGRLISQQGYQVGVAGINTAWLCKDDDKENLTPGKSLLETALAGISAADLRIVLGHHPIDWLLPDEQRAMKALLGKQGVLYLHGHLHEQWTEPTHGGGGQFLAIQTGAAYQAEEHETWRNGLLWGKADLVTHKLRLQPHVWSKHHQDWTPKGDAFPPTFKKGEWWEYDLPGKRAAKPAATAPPPPEPALVPGVLALTRPALKPLPPDAWADIGGRFIGRVVSLSDVASAVTGLRQRAAGEAPPSGAQAVKLVWVHGFGGMGKSWFLHRARQQAEATGLVRALIVEWDSPEWRVPLKGDPQLPEDIFEVLAYRLAQVVGPAAVEPYRQADEQIAAASSERERLRNKFGEQLQAAYKGNDADVDGDTRHLLHSKKLWDDDLTERRRNMNGWWDRSSNYDQGFAAWCRAGAHSTNPAVFDPDGLRAESLGAALQQAARQQPLLLLLDTNEVLNEELDTWLRRLLMPLLRDDTPLLVLVGSRRQPDVDQPGSSRDGWRAELSEHQRREIDFAEAKRFTVGEIEEALTSLRTPWTGDCAGLAERLYRLTQGVPLAVRTLLNLHEDGDDLLLTSLTDESEDDENDLATLGNGQAVQRVIQHMVERLLLHLHKRRQHADDLRDIVALGLLQRADPEVLRAYWRTDAAGVRARLRRLGNDYALLSGGDLHTTVRSYLRLHWRREDVRPDEFDGVLSDLQAAVVTLPDDWPAGSPEALGRALLRLNLRAWQEPAADVLPLLAQVLAVALAHDVTIEPPVEALLRELSLPGAAHKLWQTIEIPARAAVVEWLERLPTAGWPAFERQCLTLVGGLALVGDWWQMKADKALAAFKLLEEAATGFSLARLPQPAAVGQAYFRIARSFYDEDRGVHKQHMVVEQAYKRAITLDANAADAYNNLGSLLSGQPGRAAEAEVHYRMAFDLDPQYVNAHNNLGYLLADQPGRAADAEAHYRMALDLDPKSVYAHNGLGYLLADQLGRAAAAEAHYRTALDLDPAHGSSYRGLAWLILINSNDIHTVRAYVEKAQALDAEHPAMLLAESGLAAWEGGWVTARLKLAHWLESALYPHVSPNDHRLIALSRKLREQGHLPELAAMLQAVADDARPWWRPWHEAVAALAAGQGAAACTTDEAHALYQRLSE